jgi:hypothetical protein
MACAGLLLAAVLSGVEVIKKRHLTTETTIVRLMCPRLPATEYRHRNNEVLRPMTRFAF